MGQDEEGERMEVVELEGESFSSWFVGVGWTRENVWRGMEQVLMEQVLTPTHSDCVGMIPSIK